MSEKEEELTEENLATSVVITDAKSGESVTINLHNLNNEFLAVNLKPSSLNKDAYDITTMMAVACVVKGIEDPTRIFSIEDMMETMQREAGGMPNWGGEMGEA